MNSRLDVLLRQRELLREHLDWLEAEIAGARGPQPTSHAVPPSASPLAPASPPPTAADLPDVDVPGLQSEVRRGCLLYAAIAVAALGALIAFIYWRY